MRYANTPAKNPPLKFDSHTVILLTGLHMPRNRSIYFVEQFVRQFEIFVC